MSWLDVLQGRAAEARKAAPAVPIVQSVAVPKRRPIVNQLTVMVRQPSGSDPGEVTTGYYVIDDGALHMTDVKGELLKDEQPIRLKPESNAQSIASSLTRKRWDETRGDFWRRLDHPPLSIA